MAVFQSMQWKKTLRTHTYCMHGEHSAVVAGRITYRTVVISVSAPRILPWLTSTVWLYNMPADQLGVEAP